LLADAEVGPLIRKLASRQGAFTEGAAGSKKVFLHRGLSEVQRRRTLIHELTHFYAHKLFSEWVETTAAARYYSEGFTEYLARQAMTADQLADGKSYQAQVESVENQVAAYVPQDDIARAFFLGEVWRIEGKSKVAKKAFKEQVELDPEGEAQGGAAAIARGAGNRRDRGAGGALPLHESRQRDGRAEAGARRFLPPDL
jgi:hypothetical protein